jgi:hypothetical protein
MQCVKLYAMNIMIKDLESPWFSRRLPKFLVLRIDKSQKSYNNLTHVARNDHFEKKLIA